MYFLIDKVRPSLVQLKGCDNLKNTILSNLRSIICQVVNYGRLKTKEHFKRLAVTVVMVT